MSLDIAKIRADYLQGIGDDDPYDVIGALLGEVDRLNAELPREYARGKADFASYLERLADEIRRTRSRDAS